MAYQKLDDFKGKTFNNPYPSDNIDPKLKQDKQYFLSSNRAMISDYVNNYGFVPYEVADGKRSIAELRAYATGNQGSQKLKDSLFGAKRKSKDGKYKTSMNTSWEPFKVLPKLYDVMRQKNMPTDYEVGVNAIDEGSLASKEMDREVLKYLLDQNTKDFLAKSVYKPQQDPQAMGIQNESDVDMYFDTGGYTLQREMACMAACRTSKRESGYKVIQDQTFDDLIVTPVAGWKTYIEKSTGIPKIRRVDCAKAFIPYSDKLDFSDITRAGEIRLMSIADIRKENPSLSGADLMYLAKQFSWMPENSGYLDSLGGQGFFNRSFNINYLQDLNVDPISRVKIPVFESQWLSVDTETRVKNNRNDGTIRYKEVDFNFVQDYKSKKEGDEVIKKNTIKKYYSSWIIGTDYFVDYGVCENVVYYGEDGNKTPRIDFFFGQTGNAPLIERCIAIIDDIDLANTKLRNEFACMIPAPGIAIQKDLLENVFLNGIKQQPEDLLYVLYERGTLWVNSFDDQGKPIYQNQKLIEKIDSNSGQNIAILANEILNKINQLREVLGLSQGADASTPNPYQGLGKTKLSFEASNAALYPTYNAYTYIFIPAFEDIIKKWQITAKNKPVKVAYSPLGAKSLKIFELDKDFTNAEFGLEVEMSSSDEEKATLLQDIKELKKQGDVTGGAQGLTTSEYLYIYDRIMGGSIKEAMWVMAKIEQKKMIAAQAKANMDMQNNAQLQQQSADAKAKNDQETIKEKGSQAMFQQMIDGMFKQNNLLMEQLLSSKEARGIPVTVQDVQPHIDMNNQGIAAIIAQNQPQPEVPAQDPNQQEVPQEQLA